MSVGKEVRGGDFDPNLLDISDPSFIISSITPSSSPFNDLNLDKNNFNFSTSQLLKVNKANTTLENNFQVNNNTNAQSTNVHSNCLSDVPLESLQKSILDMVNDKAAFNLSDLMVKPNEHEDFMTHIITIKPNSEPVKQKTRGVPQSFKNEFKKSLEEMKAAGMVIDSKSPWCSPVRLVKKPDGSIRVCVDYRKVNNATIKDSFPIPKIEDIFNQLGKAKIFSTIDLASGYYQIRMDPNSRQYTAFATQWGFYEYTVMSMGLTNACATFQRVMNKVLEGYLDEFCLVYLDDIIISSDNEEDHLKHVQRVIERLRKYNMKIKLSKCKFARTRIEYLSHIIENGELKTNPDKIIAVSNTPRPKNVKQLQSFLGLVSYYRKFIKNCSTIASPLIQLTQKDSTFVWTTECETAFQILRTYLCSTENVLHLPDFNLPFQVECDASKYGVGGVLSQKFGSHFQPVAYFSKHLNKTEKSYSTSEREMLAIVLSVEHFRQCIYGRQIKIITDHEPLKFLSTADVPAPRLARLQKRLNIYNYTIEYRAGKLNGNADALSRMVDDSDESISLEKESIIINAIHLTNQRPKSNLDQNVDDDLKWIIDLLQQNKIRPNIIDFKNAERQSLYKQWDRLYILKNTLFREYIDAQDNVFYQYIVPKSQREFILQNNHDTAVCGHLGFEKTRDRITHKYYWFKQAENIKKYCQECIICQRAKISNKYNKTLLNPIFSSKPHQLITTDMMGPFPTSGEKYQHILVVVDHFTKYVEFFPMVSTTAQETARVLLQYISRHSCQEMILSDQGSNFQAQLVAELWELLDVKGLRTTPYRPSTDGQTERNNRTLQLMLTCYVNEKKDNWSDYLCLLQLAYNTSINNTTKYSPFELMYGREPKMPIDLIFNNEKLDLYLGVDSYARDIQDNLARAFSHVATNTKLSINPHKIRHDREIRASSTYKVNDYVWLRDMATKKNKCKKLSDRWKGPYLVTDVIDDANFKLKAIDSNRTTIVNKERLRKCFERKILTDKKLISEKSTLKSNEITNPDKVTTISTEPKSTTVKNNKKKSMNQRKTKNKISKNSIFYETPFTNEQVVNNDGKRIRKKPNRYVPEPPK